jgi:hypothetical protein
VPELVYRDIKASESFSGKRPALDRLPDGFAPSGTQQEVQMVLGGGLPTILLPPVLPNETDTAAHLLIYVSYINHISVM